MTSDIPSEDLETLKAQRAHLEEQIARVATQISAVVVKDIPNFLERETRWRWLQHTTFATDMSDDQIRALKTNVKQLADNLQPSLAKELAAAEPWLSPNQEPEVSQNKSLIANPEVWAILQKIACQLSGLLSNHQFPTDPAQDETAPPYHIVYRTPAYFLDGQYCPRLIENYWNHVGHLNKIDEVIQGIHDEANRTTLEKRWSSI